MASPALVGDIGGTNSRFALVDSGVAVREIEKFKNDDFPSLEAAAREYLDRHGHPKVRALSFAIAGPVTEEPIALTNRDWRFTRASLKEATGAAQAVILNDFEALAWSLPHLSPEDLVQIGGHPPEKPSVKLVLGPGTGLGMATLAPLPKGGWMPLAGELGHGVLPVVTREEFDLREAMTLPGVPFESEDAITGPGILRMYNAICDLSNERPSQHTPEAVIKAAVEDSDKAARHALDQFVIWLARLAGDAAMMMQAKGGIYLAGGIAPSIIDELKKGPFRTIFQEKGRLAHVMRPIPIYVITDRYPAFKGCAAALARQD
jgi:glucokinase